jgi:hypothetical protein
MEERIRQQIERLRAERDEFVRDVNMEIAFRNGQIAALEALLQPDPDTEREGNHAIPVSATS